MRRLPALVAALLLPAAQPLRLGTALFTSNLLVSEAPAMAADPRCGSYSGVQFMEFGGNTCHPIRNAPKWVVKNHCMYQVYKYWDNFRDISEAVKDCEVCVASGGRQGL
jgi:hypothetical protein